jgi:hypothetical protein
MGRPSPREHEMGRRTATRTWRPSPIRCLLHPCPDATPTPPPSFPPSAARVRQWRRLDLAAGLIRACASSSSASSAHELQVRRWTRLDLAGRIRARASSWSALCARVPRVFRWRRLELAGSIRVRASSSPVEAPRACRAPAYSSALPWRCRGNHAGVNSLPIRHN